MSIRTNFKNQLIGGIMTDIKRVEIIANPPVDTWCFGLKGSTFEVIEKDDYYVIAHDEEKNLVKKRCIAKSHAAII